ncbi:cytochrome c oxidase assembly protein [Allokutzneria oryzae]|uniref:Cytochrome c oxidase assembly protein n=1 Tax=Allokutzneria oryzae TaxID=1378989 RepID=A0ABV5ZX56_9PSEU
MTLLPLLSDNQNLPPLTLVRAAGVWKVAPVALALVAVLAAAHLWAVRRVRLRGERWPAARTIAFHSGLATHLVATSSFLGVYAHTLFWARAAQVIISLMVTPLLIAIGAPVTLLLAVVPATTARVLRRVGRGTAAKALTFPLLITAALAVPLAALYLTPLYEWTIRRPYVDEPLLLVIAASGFVYYWTRLRADPTPRDDPHLVSFAISLTEAIVDGVVGLVLWFGPLVAGDYYQALHRGWGPDVQLDQILGAGIIWIGGDLAGLPFVAALLLRWMRADERHARDVDRHLDAEEETARQAASPSVGALWWETDPVLRDRYRGG